MAHAPRDKAIAHFDRFAQLMMRFRGDVSFVRTVARASFPAPDPIRAAEGFIADYDAIVAQLTPEGVEPSIARSLAGIASLGAEPLATAGKLLENFEAGCKEDSPRRALMRIPNGVAKVLHESEHSLLAHGYGFRKVRRCNS